MIAKKSKVAPTNDVMSRLSDKSRTADLTRQRWLAAPVRAEEPPTALFRFVAVAACLFWVVVTIFLVSHVSTVGSPDEAANSYFMTYVARTGHYRIDTGLPVNVMSYLQPRSIITQGQFLVPSSFLGLIQVGAVAMDIFGTGAERWLTPLLALAGLVAVFFIFRRFWGRWWALLGVALIALHPAFFEFMTLPYLHNGAFVGALMVAAWALLRLLERPSWYMALGFGFAFGVALYFRPVEALWSAPVVAILLLARKLWRELLIVGLVVVAVQLPWLLANRSVYGSFLSSGYTPTGVFSDSVGGEAVIAPAKKLFTPAGGSWSWHWLSSMWWYFVLLVPSWSALSLVALSRYFRRKYVSWSKAFKLSAITLLGLFPFIYYGTWNLYPTTPAADVGALASYVRYWLPLYIIMAPGVLVILRLLRHRWFVIAVAAVMLISQVFVVWAHPVSGIHARVSADTKNAHIRKTVLQLTEPNAVLIAGHDDKYFQDQRLSTFDLPSTVDQWQALQDLVALRPVYLYVAVGAVNIDQARTAMQPYHLTMTKKFSIGRDGVWQLSALP